ncbi:MAG: S49 family peptidase [Pseudomonadota bacterium]
MSPVFRRLQAFLPKRFRSDETIIPTVRMSGVISPSSGLRPNLNLAGVAPALDKAFKIKEAPAVAILVNSPGGSPVQSRLIYQRVRSLAEEKEKQVLVFVEDVAASGGYMIALAGDEIFADPTSVVGSIGVVAAGFGFVDLIEKIGVERRVYTAGKNKVILDPFQPKKQQDVDHLLGLQEDMHEIFIDMVKERRGDLLREDEDLFSGLFWTGRKARDFGLVDDLGDLQSVLRSKFGEDAKPRLITTERGFPFRRSGVGGVRPYISADDILSSLEERALLARYGL